MRESVPILILSMASPFMMSNSAKAGGHQDRRNFLVDNPWPERIVGNVQSSHLNVFWLNRPRFHNQ